MHLSAWRKLRRLPKHFPVGTTYVVEGYVVEGHGNEAGHLQVFSRYVVLPTGQRINLGANLDSPAAPRRRPLPQSKPKAQPRPGKASSGEVEKIMAGGGTSLRDRR
jgi:hypothetical protein